MPLCVIVGMGRGMSLGIARRFGAEGFSIAMVARKTDALTDIEQTLTDAGITARSFTADAAGEPELRSAFRAIRDSMGDAEVLVYNASSGTPGPATALGRDALIRDFDVNVTGAIAAVQEVLPSMKQNGKGTVFITGGGLALEPQPALASLSLGKAAQRSLAFSLAKELEPVGIHVATVTICGFVEEGTPFAPDRIAEEYWKLHTQPKGEWKREIVYR